MSTPNGESMRDFTIVRVSTADTVANAVREKILRGVWSPGTPLQEAAIASSVGVSRNTMREAIRILVHEGLLRHTVHRGVSVTALTRADVEEIYLVRRRLEQAGVAAAAAAPDQHLARLLEIADDIDRVARSGDHAQLVATDLLFHRQIVSFVSSSRLDQFFNALLSELRLALALVDIADQSSTRLVTQHRRLATLLINRETVECTRQLTLHLRDSERNLIAAIRLRGGATAEL